MIFFFNDTATTEIYTLSLHDALPIWGMRRTGPPVSTARTSRRTAGPAAATRWTPAAAGTTRATTASTWSTAASRSEEHTSELQSRQYLVCRLLLEKKKKISNQNTY